MATRAELLFDFVSPNAYLVFWPLRDIVRRHEAELVIIPAFLGGIMKLTGNSPPLTRNAAIKGKNDYMILEMDRFIARHELARFRMRAQFPFNSILLQRLLTAADEDGHAVQFVEALLPAVWEDHIDIADRDAVSAAVRQAGFDAADLFARAESDAVKQRLAANTDAAVARGAFGIPTMWVGDEMFFGKERLVQVEELLGQR